MVETFERWVRNGGAIRTDPSADSEMVWTPRVIFRRVDGSETPTRSDLPSFRGTIEVRDADLADHGGRVVEFWSESHGTGHEWLLGRVRRTPPFDVDCRTSDGGVISALIRLAREIHDAVRGRTEINFGGGGGGGSAGSGADFWATRGGGGGGGPAVDPTPWTPILWPTSAAAAPVGRATGVDLGSSPDRTVTRRWIDGRLVSQHFTGQGDVTLPRDSMLLIDPANPRGAVRIDGLAEPAPSERPPDRTLPNGQQAETWDEHAAAMRRAGWRLISATRRAGTARWTASWDGGEGATVPRLLRIEEWENRNGVQRIAPWPTIDGWSTRSSDGGFLFQMSELPHWVRNGHAVVSADDGSGEETNELWWCSEQGLSVVERRRGPVIWWRRLLEPHERFGPAIGPAVERTPTPGPWPDFADLSRRMPEAWLMTREEVRLVDYGPGVSVVEQRERVYRHGRREVVEEAFKRPGEHDWRIAARRLVSG